VLRPTIAGLPLVFISAQDPAPTVLALADGCLRKPFGNDRLLEVVARYAGDRSG
jgi:hypothetical protein